MTWKNMQIAPTKDGGDSHLKSFEYSDSLAAAGNGNSIIIPDDIQNIAIAIKPTGCNVKFQYTVDSVSEVKAGTEEWFDSDLGLVAVDTSDVLYPCTAIRLVQSGAGSSIIKVRAQ